MGIFINTGNEAFLSARNGEYVDKSGLIAIINSTLFSTRRFSCVTRSRRFGKSLAAQMLCAYYDRSCQSRELFADLEIASHHTFEQHLNKYPVIYLDLTSFVTRFRDDSVVSVIEEELMADIHANYPDVPVEAKDDLMKLLIRIASATGQRFFFIIDEWDAICREFDPGTKAMDEYVNWLRRMFKDYTANLVFAGVYMTGILPVKKYKTQSALNNFVEYSMVEPMDMAHFFGFTKDEVKALAEKHAMDFDELEKWYDGYQIGDEHSIFNPNSVMMAVRSRRCRSYWASTGAFDAISGYIRYDFDGLKDDIISMLAGGRCEVDPTRFRNDLSEIGNRDDVLTVLIHLGYLSYNWREDECYVPNREVAGEMVNAVKETKWGNIAETLQQSKRLLQATLNGDAEAVAHGVDSAHDENTSILSYNDENSLACVLSIAYYYARNDYVIHRELPTGKGFADLVLIPRKNVDSPAIVLELKCNKDADTAIDQIKRKNYPAKVLEYTDNLLLVGINYDRQTKQHKCHIEKAE
jgi:hypothetical protein